MRRTWKKACLPGILVLAALLMMTPVNVQAKKAKADKGIALTAKNFPDKSFLQEAKTYDKDKNGYLSKTEIAAVTGLSWESSLSDFSQICYFTNLKSLSLSGWGYGLWLGDELDLTCFSKLETVWIDLDTKDYRADADSVLINASGLKKLKRVHIHDAASVDIDDWSGSYDGSDANIDVVDLRNTPVLQEVFVGGAKEILFDDEAKISELTLYNLAEVPNEKIAGFTKLKRLSIAANTAGFTQIDLAGLTRLTELYLEAACLKTVALADTGALSTLSLGSSALEGIDVSKQTYLGNLRLNCPGLKKLDVRKNTALDGLYVESEQLAELDVNKNTLLKNLDIKAWKLPVLDVSKNTLLEYLAVESDRLAFLNTGNNIKLKELRLTSPELLTLDLRKNKKLDTLFVSGAKMSALDLAANTKITRLRILNTPLASVDLSALDHLHTLIIIGDEKLTELDVSANQNLENVILEGTSLASLDLQRQNELSQLTISGNRKLGELKMTSNANLCELVVKGTALKTLAFPKQKRLWKLEISDNPQLEALDLTKLPKLSTVKITGNEKLKELDFIKNEVLNQVNVSGNALETLKFGKLPGLIYLNCQKNQLSGIDLTGTKLDSLKVYCDEGVEVTGCSGSVSTDEPQETVR